MWDFSTDPDYAAKLAWARDFVHNEVLPLETLHWDLPELRAAIAPLQEQVREHGLWPSRKHPRSPSFRLNHGLSHTKDVPTSPERPTHSFHPLCAAPPGAKLTNPKIMVTRMGFTPLG